MTVYQHRSTGVLISSLYFPFSCHVGSEKKADRVRKGKGGLCLFCLTFFLFGSFGWMTDDIIPQSEQDLALFLVFPLAFFFSPWSLEVLDERRNWLNGPSSSSLLLLLSTRLGTKATWERETEVEEYHFTNGSPLFEVFFPFLFVVLLCADFGRSHFFFSIRRFPAL